MTNETQRFVELTNNEFELEKILAKVDDGTRPNEQSAAKEKLLKKGYELGVTQDNFNGERNPSEISEEDKTREFNTEYITRKADSTHYFESNVGKIIENTDSNKLENLLGIEAVSKNANENEKKVMNTYISMRDVEEFKERYDNKKGLTEKEQERIKHYVEDGIKEESKKREEIAEQKEKSRQEKMGYINKSLIQNRKDLARNAAMNMLYTKDDENIQEVQRRYASEGINSEITSIKEKYDSLSKDNGDIAWAIKGATERTLTSGDSKTYEQIRRTLYAINS